MGRARPVGGTLARCILLGSLLGTAGCGALREVRDEIIGVKPAVSRCFENRDHVTPAWIPIPHLACRGGTPRVPRPEKPERRPWPTDWLEAS